MDRECVQSVEGLLRSIVLTASSQKSKAEIATSIATTAFKRNGTENSDHVQTSPLPLECNPHVLQVWWQTSWILGEASSLQMLFPR